MRGPMESNVDDLNVGVKEGDVLAGKYRVDRVLGIGGMGAVVQATHLVLNDRVALKFLLPELLEHEATTHRFLREAQAAVRIKSPHVARVTDVGKLESGSPYMVMEFLDGRDLGSVLEKEAPLEPEVAIDFALQASEAVAAAHANNVIHRDIKPANLFITKGPDNAPVLKVLDFGISKVAKTDGVGSLTQTHTAMGSPLYMSPEQMRSAKDVDPRTDVWSLGIVLYEMLTGTLPFVADTMPQLCALILETVPPSMKLAVPDLPDQLDKAVLKAIERDPAERYQDIGEFAAAIAPFGDASALESAHRVMRILQTAGMGSSDLDVPVSVVTADAVHSRVVVNTSTSFGITGSGASGSPRRGVLYAAAAVGIGVISMSTAWAIYRIGASETNSTTDIAVSAESASLGPPSTSQPIATVEHDLAAPSVATSASAVESVEPPPKVANPTIVRPVVPRDTKPGSTPPKPTSTRSILDDRE